MKSKKIISLLTAIVLCSGVGTAVLADETDAAADAQTETVTEAASDDVTETEEAAPAEDTADDTAVPEEETAPADDTPVVDTSAIEAVAEKADAIEDSDALLEDENVLYAYSGSCGPTLNYTFDEGVLTISGTGEMSSYPWDSFRSDIQQLVIEPGCTEICSYAFGSCSSLSSISIPDTVVDIDGYAFIKCDQLVSVSLPLCRMYSCVFGNCTKLQTVTIRKGTGSGFIESNAFSGCVALQEITIPEGITSIKRSAFEGCVSLTDVALPSTVTTIDERAFYMCEQLKSITIPDACTSIGQSAFYGCISLTSVILPNCEIYDTAFFGCSSLESVYIKYGDTKRIIGSQAFTGCEKLSVVSLPESISEIRTQAFYECFLLEHITIPGSVKTINHFAFMTSGLVTADIKEGVTEIGNSAFFGCNSLKAVNIPSTITTIENDAFKYCTDLHHVHIANNKSAADFAGKYGLPEDTNCFYVLNSDGTCPDPNCPLDMHVIGPDKPVVTATAGNGKIDLKWNKVTDATSYKVYSYENGTLKLNTTVTDTKASITGLKNGTRYGFVVRAVKDGKESDYTIFDVIYATPTNVLAKPTVVVKTAFGGKTMTFNCTDKDAVIYYNIGSSNITTSCKKLANGGTVFFDTPMAKPVYFKAYKNGTWSAVSKNGLNNVKIAKPLCVQSGAKAKNEFKIYTQTKNSYIVYTLDGSVPSINEGTQSLKVKNGRLVWSTSTVINIPKGRTIKAIAIRNGLVTSDVMTYTNK